MLDRTTPPPASTIDYPHFSWPEAYQLKEGIPLWVLNAGKQPMIKIELVCDAGSWYEPHNGVAYFTARMLQEGTQHKSAQDIASYVDQYGASLQVQVQPDTCSFILVTLSQYLDTMLALLTEVLLAPTFSEQRLAHLKHLIIQKLKVDAQKNSYVARKKFKEVLFGITHPYGRQLTETAIADITTTHLQQYYRDRLLAGCRLLVSGQVYERDLYTIQRYLQPLPVQAPVALPALWPTQGPIQVHCPKEGSLQAAIIMGKVLLTQDHPDYLPLLVVNELLGGYFGSRLMCNIREEKGYTYGIFSRIVPLQRASYLLIATEVIQTFAQVVCQEIEREIKTLQTILVQKEELEALRNHMHGTFLSEVNDPFSIMEKFKDVNIHGLEKDHYKQLDETIRRISSPQIMELANDYLSTDSLSQVTVG
ncbi:MAG: insulinase family protein [Amoebophilaceae bacterium]|jgi:predicted Zn-dependent peptidase|nr:insulinase family protein [Amoebophilaceae bacterium]